MIVERGEGVRLGDLSRRSTFVGAGNGEGCGITSRRARLAMGCLESKESKERERLRVNSMSSMRWKRTSDGGSERTQRMPRGTPANPVRRTKGRKVGPGWSGGVSK